MKYESLLRPTYEAYSAAAWAASAVIMAGIGLLSAIPSVAFVWMASISLLFALFRGWQARRAWEGKASLAGKPFSYLEAKQLVDYCKADTDHLWMGYGFRWEQSHSQKAYEVLKQDLKDVYPPAWYMKLRGSKFNPIDGKGDAWIHGLEPEEKNVLNSWASSEGHTTIFGTTGAGKTRLFEVLLLQMAVRNDAIVVIDPKGDKDLENLCRDVMRYMNRSDRFIKFHPAFPSESVRLDVMADYNRGTEHASRLATLVGSEADSDTFTAVTWEAIYCITAGQRYLGSVPRIASIYRYMSGGIDGLLEEVLRRFFEKHLAAEWQHAVSQLQQKEKPDTKRGGSASNLSPELIAYIKYFKSLSLSLREGEDAAAARGLIRMAEMDRGWQLKMVAGILPLLTMLTAEELGPMLSPDYEDVTDERPIFTPKKVVEGRYLLYVGLDSLSDQAVGSAIASMLLSNMASLAGSIYNYENGKEKVKIQVVIDEAAEVANDSLIQLLNKARGAGFSITLAAQTYADYVDRLGTKEKARKLLGNCNNVISLRVRDGETQQFVTEQIGETFIKQKSQSRGSGNKTEDHGLEFSGNITESVSEQRVEMFPQQLLGRLPDLQYMAMFAGGKLVKGRIPKLSQMELPKAA